MILHFSKWWSLEWIVKSSKRIAPNWGNRWQIGTVMLKSTLYAFNLAPFLPLRNTSLSSKLPPLRILPSHHSGLTFKSTVVFSAFLWWILSIILTQNLATRKTELIAFAYERKESDGLFLFWSWTPWNSQPILISVINHQLSKAQNADCKGHSSPFILVKLRDLIVEGELARWLDGDGE